MQNENENRIENQPLNFCKQSINIVYRYTMYIKHTYKSIKYHHDHGNIKQDKSNKGKIPERHKNKFKISRKITDK